MPEFEPKPFGKYFLTEKIAVGGMAEIYKAKTFGVDGFEKLLAIKKILSHYSADKEFIAMLTDEAKLVVRLAHTNIVQIYDLGKVGDDYYISMEYIDGVNLREVINRAKELGKSVPLPICLYIISEVCKGLDYAHSKKDDKGHHLEIVHRDISPQNILISFEGETKIVDFGIAKAALNISHTSSGTLKGKITYMSPEQALGKPVDAQTDVYSTAILLYELISGERLYTGETQFEVLKKIRTTQFTEKTLKDKVPKEVASILAKALAYEPKNRHQTAGDFQIALTKLLYTKYSDFSPKQLSDLIKEWFATELKKVKEKTQQAESIDNHTRSILLDASNQKSIVEAEASKKSKPLIQDTTKPEDALTPAHLKHGEPEESSQNLKELPTGKVRISQKKSSLKPAIFTFVTLVLVAGLFLTYYFFLRPRPGVTEKGSIELTSTPAEAQIFLDGEDMEQTTPYTLKDLELNHSYTISLKKEGFQSWSQEINLENNSPYPLEVNLEVIPKATLEIESIPFGAKIFLNETDTNKETNATLKDLAIGSTYKMKLIKEGFYPYEQEVTLENDTPVSIKAKLQEILYSSISIRSTPIGAQVFLDGQDTGLLTPTSLPKLEVNTTHEIKLTKEGHKEIVETITLTSKNPVKLNLKLDPLVVVTTGKIKIETNVSGALVIINGNQMGYAPNTFEVKEGKITIELSKKGYQKNSELITLAAGESKTIIMNLEKEVAPLVEKEGTLSISSSPSGAEVYVGGTRKGKTPLTLELKGGTWNVVIKKEGYQNYSKSIKVVGGEIKSVSATLLEEGTSTPPNNGGLLGDVRIDSNPRGASVIFDGQKAGITPVVIPNVPQGTSHSIEVSLPGYKTWTNSFTMNQKKKEFSAKLVGQ